MKVRDLMTTEVFVIGPEQSLREAAQMMRDCDVGSLPVHKDDRLVAKIDAAMTMRGIIRDASASAGV